MEKSTKVLLIVGLISFVIGAAGYFAYQHFLKSQIPMTNSQTADWKTYTNNEYGFEFQYPPAYQVYEINPKNILVVRPEDKDVKDTPTSKIRIEIFDNARGLGAREWWNEYGAYAKTNEIGVNPNTFPITNEKVGGMDAIYIGGLEGVLTNYFVLPKGNKIFEILDMMPIKILSTFKFIK